MSSMIGKIYLGKVVKQRVLDHQKTDDPTYISDIF